MSNLKQQLTQLMDTAISVTDRLQHNILGANDIAALRSSMNSILPMAERHERLLRTVDVNGLNDLALGLEVCAINLWNGVVIAIKTESVEQRKILCSVKFFACLLCSIHESLGPSLKDKFRTLNCLYRSLRTAVDEDELQTAAKIQEHADRVFKSLESLSSGFEKEVFKEFQRVKTELFITKMQLSVVEGDVQMAKFYEERAEVYSDMIGGEDQLRALETLRVIFNTSLILSEKNQHDDVVYFLKKAMSLASQISPTTESTQVKRSVCSLLIRSCLELNNSESLDLAHETIQAMEALPSDPNVDAFELAIELAKRRELHSEIEGIIMRMIMAVPIASNFKSILGIINDYANLDPSSAIKCYEYAFTNKLDPNTDHQGLEMLFVAMVNAYIKNKTSPVITRQTELDQFLDNAERIFIKNISKKCSSSSITLLWTAGKSSMKVNEFGEAVSWLKLGLHRVFQINDIDKAKFQRSLQNCFINLEDYQSAIDVYNSMNEYAKDSLITQYNMFKVYSYREEDDLLMVCLKKIVEYDEKILIPLLALCAINCKSNTRVAVESMMQLFKKINSGFESEVSVASTLKCVIELILKESADATMKDQYKETLLSLLQEATSFAENNPGKFTNDELKWFGSQSFNVARDCIVSEDYFYGDLFAECSIRLVNLVRDDISLSDSMALKLWRFRAGLMSIMCQSQIINVDHNVVWGNVRTKALNLRIMIDELMIVSQQRPEFSKLKKEWEKCLLDCMVFQFQAELELDNQGSVESIIKESQKHRTIEFDSTLVNIVFDAKYSSRMKSLVLAGIIERNIPDTSVPATTISRWVRLLLKQADIDTTIQKVLTQIITRLGSQPEDNKFPSHEVEWMSTQCWNRGVGLVFNGDRRQGSIWCTHAMRLSKFVNERLETNLSNMWQELMSG